MVEKELPVRKNVRLKGYDYSSTGAYFVTFCVKGGHELLGKIVGAGFHPRPLPTNPHQLPEILHPYVELTDLGIAVQKSIEYIHAHTKNVEIPKHIVMPNHVHMLVVLGAGGSPQGAGGDGTPPLHSVMGRIKSYSVKPWNEDNASEHFSFWQRNYYDHIIRDEAEYKRIWQYIDENPARWEEDCYYPKANE